MNGIRYEHVCKMPISQYRKTGIENLNIEFNKANIKQA